MSIIVFVGTSGVGKSTTAEMLCERYHAKFLPCYTTRPQRADEIHRKSEYIFDVPREHLQRWYEAGDLEWINEFAGNLYGTKKSDIQKAATTEELWVTILVPGVLPLLNRKVQEYSGKITYLFLDPAPRDVLETRMMNRKLSTGEHAQRMAKIKWYEDEAKKTGIDFIHITNEGSIEELLLQVREKAGM